MTRTNIPLPTGEIRHNDDGTVDEIVASDVSVHVEQMSDECFWMSLTFADGTSLDVNFWTPRTRIRLNWMREGIPESQPVPAFDEGGEFSSGVKPLPEITS